MRNGEVVVLVEEREVGRWGEENTLIVRLDRGCGVRRRRRSMRLDEIGRVEKECDQEGKTESDNGRNEARCAEREGNRVEEVGEQAAGCRAQNDTQAGHGAQEPHVLWSVVVVDNVCERGSTHARGPREKARGRSQGDERGEGRGEDRDKGGGGKEDG